MPSSPEPQYPTTTPSKPRAMAHRRTTLQGCQRLGRRLGAAVALILAGTLAAAVPAAATPASAAPLVTAPVVTAPVATAPLVTAADGKDFDAGNIITDEVFFDRTSLTAGQVRAFLRLKAPTCLAQPGRPDCLKNYRVTTPTRPKDAYCKRYKGATNELASKIIAKVARACGVSAKVLLVLLQKEQSLVTSSAPTPYQYERATGFACPDTAPCDEQYFGFFNQVYHAARQYQRYADPDSYTWRSIGMNTLLYNPKASCGTTEVNVRNQATLGLYFYTPYVPNQAALDNMYGTGDSCSSYGNRNFWRGFTDWFGSTKIAVRGPIQKAWLASGGLDGTVGVQRAHEVCGTNGNYCAQRFARGTVAKSAKKGSFVMTGAFEQAWRKAGANRGALKWPYNSAKERKADQSTMQRFTRGYLVDSARFGMQQITGPAAKVWRKNKHRKGRLGLPRAAAKCSGKNNQRCVQQFVGGYVTVHPKRGNRAVTGKVASFWQKKKLDKGGLGFPSSAGKCVTKKGVTTCRQSFGKVRVVSSTKYNTRTVRGKLAKVWDKKRSKVGNPVKNRKCSTKGKGKNRFKVCEQQFTKGWITNSGRHGAFFVAARFAKLYSNNKGKLGIPTSNRKCTKKSGKKTCTQKFTKGKIVKKGSKKPRVRT